MVERRQEPTGKVTAFQKAYYWAFIFALLICWSPFNALAYIVPFLVIGWMLVATRSGTIALRTCLWLLGWGILTMSHGLVDRDFVWFNAPLALATYATFGFAFVIPSKRLADRDLLDRMLKWALFIVLIEAIWGIVQAAYGFSQTGTFDRFNGDFVEGTIDPSLKPELAFSNTMYAANMAFLLLFLLPRALRGRSIFHLILGSIALILSSVMHVLLFMFSGLVITLLLYQPYLRRKKAALVGAVILIVLPIIAYLTLTVNFGTTTGFARQLLAGEVPRSQAVKRAFTDMLENYPYIPWIGLGPGQFSSRAGLIGTGLYFGGLQNPRPIPFFPHQISDPQNAFLMDLWYWHASTPSYGSTQKPYFSWLSVYTEFGAFALLAAFLAAFGVLWTMKTKIATPADRVLAVSVGTCVLLFLLLGMQENYWEVPQAVFVGVMLIKVGYANLTSPRACKTSVRFAETGRDTELTMGSLEHRQALPS
jgi:hypothetical protein